MNEEELLHEVDDRLLVLTQKLHLLKYLTPTNIATEREHFVAMKGNYDPRFSYHFPPAEEINAWVEALHDMKTVYFDGQIYENIISKLLLDKIEENIVIAKLLLAYSEQDFVNIEKYNTILYGTFNPELLKQAEDILQSYKEPNPELRGTILTGDEIQQYILTYMQKHNITDVKITPNTSSAAKFIISFGKNICYLSYSPQMKIREYILEADLIHELQTHYTRYAHGKKTGWNIFTFGTQNYLTDEEGLALYNVCAYYKTFYPAFQKIGIYQKYLLLQQSQGISFREVATYIQDKKWSKNLSNIFTMILRCKQGIQDTSVKNQGNIFLKNKLYVDGYHHVSQRVAQGNDVNSLLQAKVKIDDLPYFLG
ncbi:MAG: DUF1704 domain-containing protein [candidate division SR1 bacterium]|nr:DUF1704 domain-containing protein [candidate division SR1 bacterium]